MPIRQIVCHVAECDLCKQRLTVDDGELRLDTPAQVADWAAGLEWTDLGGGRLACTASDAAHDDARDAVALAAA
jgi:hypothetical protein